MYTDLLLQLINTILTKQDSVSVYNWMYEDGVVLQGLLESEKIFDNSNIREFVTNYLNYFVTEEGRIPKIETRPSSVDCLNNGKIILAMYERTQKESYRKALEYLYHYIKKHPRLDGTTAFAHKAVYENQMWLDGLYMLQPLYAGLVKDFGEPSDYTDIANQFAYIEQFAYDKEKQLFYHAYDHSRKMFWCNKDTGHSPHFWGRAMGWLGMAAVDTLDLIPLQYEEERRKILSVVYKLAEGIVRYQTEDGVWFQITDLADREGNYKEASCSCMYVYFLEKAVQKGYLPSKFHTIAQTGLEGILKNFVTTDEQNFVHVHHICQVAGLGPAKKPERDGSFTYYINEPVVSDDNKAVGPLLLALLLFF